MSRSYRKFLASKEHCRTSKDRFKPKTYANRAVRRYKDIPTGKGGYKKIYDHYLISDYRIIDCMNETEVKNDYEKGDFSYWNCSTYQEALWLWKKWFIRK